MKRSLIACLVIVGVVWACAVVYAGIWVFRALDDFIGIPPQALTYTRMVVTKARILEYAQAHDHLPPDLSVLPPHPEKDCSVEDEWRRKIIYEVDSSGTVTLKSLGRDGKVGGAGVGADIICGFHSHDAQGKWSDQFGPWDFNSLAKR
jgi:hypothetical protein